MSETIEDTLTQINKLLQQKKVMVDYLLMKIDQQDWHGIADAAMDIREICAKLSVLFQIEGVSAGNGDHELTP